MSGHRLRTLFIISLILLTAASCRRIYTYVPIEGTITLKGKPMADVQVIFIPDYGSGMEGPRSMGTTDASGHYQLQTDYGDKGAIPGKHHVCIIESRLPEGALAVDPSRNREPPGAAALMQGARRGPAIVPPEYGQVNKTPLHAEVRSGVKQTFDFNIP